MVSLRRLTNGWVASFIAVGRSPLDHRYPPAIAARKVDSSTKSKGKGGVSGYGSNQSRAKIEELNF